MPNIESKKLSVNDLRHAEYYNMQQTFDILYKQSANGNIFNNLMDIILSDENILLAYRNIKDNKGSKTPGTDNITIEDLGRLEKDELIKNIKYFLIGSNHGYRPKPVRRKDIPKPNGKTRPLGIPCMYDRLIQQCIKQVLEPICEAKFNDNSYGFRPDRSVEHAIARCYQYLQRSSLYYVVEFDIKGFFDNVNHNKLIKQLWAMGIQDKTLIYIIKQILKAPIKMPNGEVVKPVKGTPQGGIISPLLANIVLNELDHWVASQWQEHPVTEKYFIQYHENGSKNVGTAYRAMRKTNLKEMYIVRYADDFRIFCRSYEDAERVKIAVTKWLTDRLKLEISSEKTKIVNTKKQWMNFLGFKMKVYQKGDKWRVVSHMSDDQHEREKEKLLSQIKNIARPRNGRTERDEVCLYNAMVMGIQNYYQYATSITDDLVDIQWQISIRLTNRLRTRDGCRLRKTGRELTDFEKRRYGRSKQLRYVAGSNEPIYPIGYVAHKNPMNKKSQICRYTEEGRKYIHDNLALNVKLLVELMKKRQFDTSTELMDNKLSLFCAQFGKCAVTGKEFKNTDEIHCHHKIPKDSGGTDSYNNLILIHIDIHKLVHATNDILIEEYKQKLMLTKDQIDKVNKLRNILSLENI
jgi:group II intron reverse transcriptase/maturase